jgi:hypothetical protein
MHRMKAFILVFVPILFHSSLAAPILPDRTPSKSFIIVTCCVDDHFCLGPQPLRPVTVSLQQPSSQSLPGSHIPLLPLFDGLSDSSRSSSPHVLASSHHEGGASQAGGNSPVGNSPPVAKRKRSRLHDGQPQCESIGYYYHADDERGP